MTESRPSTTSKRRSGGRTRRRRIWISVIGVASLLTTMIAVQPAWAITFTVNSTADAVDINVGNGICRTSANTCTLRAAIQEANATLPGDTIQVPAGTYEITRAPAGDNGDDTGDFDIVSPLTIIGAGAAGHHHRRWTAAGRRPARTARPGPAAGDPRRTPATSPSPGSPCARATTSSTAAPYQTVSSGVVRLQDVTVLRQLRRASPAAASASTATAGSRSAARLIEGNATGGDGGGISNQHEVELTLTDTVADRQHGRCRRRRGSQRLQDPADRHPGHRLRQRRRTAAAVAYSPTPSGPATVRDTVFTGNAAGDPVSGDGGGGGLYARRRRRGRSSPAASFTANKAIAEGGGIAIHSGGRVTVTDTVVRDNHAEARRRRRREQRHAASP